MWGIVEGTKIPRDPGTQGPRDIGGVGMAKLYSLGSMMDDRLDPRHGSDDGWSAHSYMNPIRRFCGE